MFVVFVFFAQATAQNVAIDGGVGGGSEGSSDKQDGHDAADDF
jgi:hypothetical protein